MFGYMFRMLRNVVSPSYPSSFEHHKTHDKMFLVLFRFVSCSRSGVVLSHSRQLRYRSGVWKGNPSVYISPHVFYVRTFVRISCVRMSAITRCLVNATFGECFCGHSAAIWTQINAKYTFTLTIDNLHDSPVIYCHYWLTRRIQMNLAIVTRRVEYFSRNDFSTCSSKDLSKLTDQDAERWTCVELQKSLENHLSIHRNVPLELFSITLYIVF